MSSDFSALNIPELTVKPQNFFYNKSDSENGTSKKVNPYLVHILITEFQIENGPYYSGLEQDTIASVSSQKEESKKKIAEKLKETGGHLLKAYETEVFTDENKKKRWSHAEQRRVLEQAIRLLEKAGGGEDGQGDSPDGKDEQELFFEVGKAYLYRSRIIRTKAFTVPAKKKVYLNKASEALEWCGKLGNTKAAHYAGLVALEMNRCGLTSDTPGERLISVVELKEFLRKATVDVDIDSKEYKDNDLRKQEFFQMRIRLEELEKGSFEDQMLLKVSNPKWRRLELQRLQVGVQMPGNSENKIADYQDDLLDLLPKSFSHPIWEDTVRFLSRVYRMCQKNEFGGLSDKAIERLKNFWPGFALELWQEAEIIAQRTSALHLRWYWSQQRNLYDIAFLAAVAKKNYKCAAEIADSAKSRPAMTWQALEGLSEKDEKLKKSIEQYAQAMAGGYIPEIETEQEEPPKKSPFPNETDKDTLIIQFYLVHLKEFENGYAVICDENGWGAVREFGFKPIWEAYLKWQTVYFGLPAGERVKSAPELKALCKSMGENLGFLFDLAGEGKEKDLLIVPHDFLHRVPVHGAIRKSGKKIEVLFNKYFCIYSSTLKSPSDEIETSTKQKNGIIKYFQPHDHMFAYFQDYEKNYNHILKSLSEVAESDLYRLTLLCHGEADMVNPMFSKLKFDNDLPLYQILQDKNMFKEKELFLSACETDLMSPLDSPVDEHYSFASSFIEKGAAFVIGSMWELYPKETKLKNNLKKFNEDGDDILFDMQKELFKKFNFKNKATWEWLYHSLCLKLYQNIASEFLEE